MPLKPATKKKDGRLVLETRFERAHKPFTLILKGWCPRSTRANLELIQCISCLLAMYFFFSLAHRYNLCKCLYLKYVYYDLCEGARINMSVYFKCYCLKIDLKPLAKNITFQQWFSNGKIIYVRNDYSNFP